MPPDNFPTQLYNHAKNNPVKKPENKPATGNRITTHIPAPGISVEVTGESNPSLTPFTNASTTPVISPVKPIMTVDKTAVFQTLIFLTVIFLIICASMV